LKVLAITNMDNKEVSVPWPTLLTGMMFIQIFYWSTNQVIVQRAMAAKSLAEGQKGVLFASGMKLIGPVMLCVPAIIALHMMHELPMVKTHEESAKAIESASTAADFERLGDFLGAPKEAIFAGVAGPGDLTPSAQNTLKDRLNVALSAKAGSDWAPSLGASRNAGLNVNDYVYGIMVRKTLPPWSFGLFLAVLVGAILSSFNSALNSAATLFSLQFYKGYIKPDASETQTVNAGRNFGIGIGIASIFVAVLLADQASIFQYLQAVNGLYSVPIIAIFLLGIGTERIPAIAAKVGMVVGIGAYGFFTFMGSEIKADYVDYHWLHGYFISFLAAVGTMFIIGQIRPKDAAAIAASNTTVEAPVNMAPWKHAKTASVIIVLLTVATYVALQSAAG
jgi:SSS family solute:Na+ symporter